MTEAFICDYERTPFGRYGGALSSVRTDDLATHPIKALMSRNSQVGRHALDGMLLRRANQAGEYNRNLARMAALAAGLPVDVPDSTFNRLCSSGLDALGSAARAIRAGKAELMIAGGDESMSYAPVVVLKAESAFSRNNPVYKSTIGWRFVNPKMRAANGFDAMPETAENVALAYKIQRPDEDAFASRSQERTHAAQQVGHLSAEIAPLTLPGKKGAEIMLNTDEHPRATTLEALAKLRPIVRAGGTVTACNTSGVNDGATALLLASPVAAARHKLTPRARVLGMATEGGTLGTMGIRPVPATVKLLGRLYFFLADIDVTELNEAFAAQSFAVLQLLKLADDDARVNAWGGAIALGHPLGASGARIVTPAISRLYATGGCYTLCIMSTEVSLKNFLILKKV